MPSLAGNYANTHTCGPRVCDRVADQHLAGRTAVVVGGSRGIGLAAGRALARAGASVILTSRSQEGADAAAAQVGRGAVGVKAHAADERDARRVIAMAIETFGSVDVLVNNAGTNPAFGPMILQDHAQFAKIFDVNVWAPLLWTRLAAESWMGEHGGAVINTSSIGGLGHGVDTGLYNVTKAALNHLTKQLALELSPGVRVNAVAPGVVRTRLSEALWKGQEDAVSASTALARLGEPDDVGNAVAFLASESASWVTGEILVIDGGQRLGDARQYR